ncbi:MAG: GNAT family N-acetyltransferase [Alphaproteobacteria bacterium]|nr:GNAT family N-acetyltransferase [Alphaproteobacteria bacterium]
MSVTFRHATEADADFLAWAMLVAARGHLTRGWFDIVLARDEAFCLAYIRHLALSRVRSWWHWSLFDVAESEGEPVCAACTFRGTGVYRVSGAAMQEASRATGLSEDEQSKLWPRGAFIISCSTGEEGALTVENVATLPAWRGQGIAEQLIRHALDKAKREGSRRAQISFLIGNDAAERCYARAGFTFEEERRTPEFEAAMGVPGLRRFARDL